MSNSEKPSGTHWLKDLDPHRGQIDRMGTLSDSVFAVAMTILVLEIRLPANWDGTIQGLGREFRLVLAAYAVSFLILVAMWSQLRRTLALLNGVDTVSTGLVMVYLALTGLVPFAVRMQMGSAAQTQLASILIYVGLVAALTAISTVLWIYVCFVSGHVHADVPWRYRVGVTGMRVSSIASAGCAVMALFTPEGKLIEDEPSPPWLVAAAVFVIATAVFRYWSLSVPKR